MRYLEEFKDKIKNGNFNDFLELWETFLAQEKADPKVFIQLLTDIQHSEFSSRLGEYIEMAIPLWQKVEDQEDSYEIIKSLINLQTTNSKTLADITYEVLESRYGDDARLEKRFRKIGLKPLQDFQGAISKYELLNHLKRGNLVFHKGEWGNGEVREVSDTKEEVTIEFEKEEVPRSISIDTALETLTPVYFSCFYNSMMRRTEDVPEQGKARKETPEAVRMLMRSARIITFKQQITETPLTTAVIHNDIEKVRQLSTNKDQVRAKNSLGFSGVDLSRLLYREKCRDILEPRTEKTFKIRPKGSTEIIIITEQDFRDYFNVKYTSSLKFGNYQLFQDVISSSNKLYHEEVEKPEEITTEVLEKYSDTPKIHKLIAQFYADKIRSGYISPITIEWIDDSMGYGIFSEKDLKKGEYIGEYFGEVRPFSLSSKKNDYSVAYLNQSIKRYRVDGTKEGNELRFANHSFEGTIHPFPAFDNGVVRVIFFASEDILKGTQLTWNYGNNFWKIRTPPQKI